MAKTTNALLVLTLLIMATLNGNVSAEGGHPGKDDHMYEEYEAANVSPNSFFCIHFPWAWGCIGNKNSPPTRLQWQSCS